MIEESEVDKLKEVIGTVVSGVVACELANCDEDDTGDEVLVTASTDDDTAELTLSEGVMTTELVDRDSVVGAGVVDNSIEVESVPSSVVLLKLTESEGRGRTAALVVISGVVVWEVGDSRLVGEAVVVLV
jgi:hypothetical protein